MKKYLLAVTICLALISCRKDPAQHTGLELKQQDNWTTEKFKQDYSIQFPSNYTGQLTGFEGNIFNKKRNGDTTLFWYFYSNGFFCFDFRDTLSDPQVASITASIYPGSAPVLLSHRITFTKNDELVGVLYHNGENVSLGRLFWKDNGVFKEAMDIRFRDQQLGEVTDIVRTIK